MLCGQVFINVDKKHLFLPFDAIGKAEPLFDKFFPIFFMNSSI